MAVLLEKFIEYLKFLNFNAASISSLSGFSSLNYSWLFGALGTVALSLYGLSLGRTRAVISLLSLYAAFTFENLFPYLEWVINMLGGSVPAYLARTGVFLLAYATFFAVLNFSFVRKRLSSADFSLFGVILISLVQLGFFASVILSFLPESLSLAWSLGLYNYFGTPMALFFWAIAPLPALLFLKRK